MKPNIALQMGDFTATGSHLHALITKFHLITKFQKDQHGLRLRGTNDKGKHNFQAVKSITAASHSLSDIPQSYALKCYIELIKCAMDSFSD